MQPVNHKISRLGLPKMMPEISSFAASQSRFPVKPVTSKYVQKSMADQRTSGLHGRLRYAEAGAYLAQDQQRDAAFGTLTRTKQSF
jgi:hypothetical protein